MWLIFLTLFLPVALFAAGISYNVDFEGLEDKVILKAIKATSDLVNLKAHPPASVNALHYRAESDVPNMLKVLHAHGYYEASINTQINEAFNHTVVTILIRPGPLYKIEEYSIFLECEDEAGCEAKKKITLTAIGIHLGMAAKATDVINAELKTLQLLSQYGYPLAHIKERKIIADGITKSINIRMTVETGSKALFGPLTIHGNEAVKDRFVKQKILWKEGSRYDSRLVERSQQALLNCELFSSVFITHSGELTEQHLLPMNIELSEGKHRSVNAGITYETVEGFGFTAGWENRNIGGMGKRLSFQGELSKKNPSGVLSYRIPDFKRLDQDFIFQLQALRYTVHPSYSERAFNGSGRIERKIKKRMSISYGVKLERLLVSQSAQDGEYSLFEIPLYFRYSSANNLLNATKGFTFEIRAVPYITLPDPDVFFLEERIVLKHYLPVIKSGWIVIAQMFTIGSILGASQHAIPLSRRFFGGSEDELRGYRYSTVSPLNDENRPLGGRSEVYYTIEPRFRISETIGIVPFLDVGNVYKNIFPSFHKKWLKALGIGLRYFSFMGPLRADFAFPLDRRRGIDPSYRFLVSIGQTF